MTNGEVIGKINTFLNLADKLSWEKYKNEFTGEEVTPSKGQKDSIRAQAGLAYADATAAMAELAEGVGVKT